MVIVQKSEQQQVVCPYHDFETEEACLTPITFTLTDDQIRRGIANIICPRCNGSIFFEIYSQGDELMISKPKGLCLG